MSGNPAYNFQFYRSFLSRAAQQERAGQWEEARKLYLFAAQSLLQVASANAGDTRESQLKEIEDLFARAESLSKGAKTPLKDNASSAVKHEDGKEFTPESVPDVSFDDIAGLENVKKEVFERIIQPMNHPELYRQFKIKPGGGILMFGLPGTGKTMIARAIAHEVKAPFFHIHCSDIKEKWVGSTEQNIRSLFERVRKESTAVMFYDEFEGIGGKTDESGGNMRGMLAELKSQMDGFDKDAGVTLLHLAATNKPWDIDSAFLRSGRFSKMIYIPLPDAASREFLFRRQFSDVPAEEGLDYSGLVNRSEGFSGADIVKFSDEVKIRAASRSVREGKISVLTNRDLGAVDFRATVVRSDIGEMRAFMQRNGFEVPEHM